MSVPTSTPPPEPVTVRLTAGEFLNLTFFFNNLDIGRVQRETKGLGTLREVNAVTDRYFALFDAADAAPQTDGTRVLVLTRAEHTQLLDFLDRVNTAALYEATPGLIFRALIQVSTEVFNAFFRAIAPAPAVEAAPAAETIPDVATTAETIPDVATEGAAAGEEPPLGDAAATEAAPPESPVA